LIPINEHLRVTNARFIPNNEHRIPTIVDLRGTNAICDFPDDDPIPI
jgi:hypothetical protein